MLQFHSYEASGLDETTIEHDGKESNSTNLSMNDQFSFHAFLNTQNTLDGVHYNCKQYSGYRIAKVLKAI